MLRFIPYGAAARGVLALLLALLASLLLAPGMARAEDEFLEPEAAFKFSARMVDGHTVAVTYQIAEGYYMYRERFKFEAQGATLGQPVIPPGKVKFDETFQKNVETYRHSLTVTIPVQAGGAFTLLSTGQGCSDKGLCYAPQQATAALVGSGGAAGTASVPGAPAGPGVTVYAIPAPQTSASGVSASPAGAGNGSSNGASVQTEAGKEAGKIERALKGGQLLAIVPLFMLLGLGLSFTPCVLPMVPILSFIIVGEGAKVSRLRGLALSATYALGMALVYTALGVAAGLAGEGLAAALQNPWVLGAFALLMAVLSLSMFGVYQLQVPAALQERLSSASRRQSSGKLAGVFAMGAISALIVGPCVAAPLAGALLYISQTRDVVIGASALFAMALGMSVPLLLVGVSAGTLLPRAGAWMEGVKRFFGVLMLAMGWWLVSPVLPAAVQMLGWTALLAGYGGYLLRARGKWLAKGFGLIFLALGLVQLVGVTTGGRDALAPLAHLQAGGAHEPLPFRRIKTVEQLDALLAHTNGRAVMLDFYADWCVSCKEMEKLTFVDPAVRARLDNAILLQVDVTANDADDKAMLKRFNLFGPPGIILFDAQGQEIPGARVIGFQDAGKFLNSLARLP